MIVEDSDTRQEAAVCSMIDVVLWFKSVEVSALYNEAFPIGSGGEFIMVQTVQTVEANRARAYSSICPASDIRLSLFISPPDLPATKTTDT